MYRTEEEAREEANNIPLETDSSYYFWIKTLGIRCLVVTDSGNPKKADIPEDMKRPLYVTEII